MELCIFGSGGHAKVIADTALELNLYERVYLYSKTNQINLSSLPKSCFFVNDDPSFTQQDNVQSIVGTEVMPVSQISQDKLPDDAKMTLSKYPMLADFGYLADFNGILLFKVMFGTPKNSIK